MDSSDGQNGVGFEGEKDVERETFAKGNAKNRLTMKYNMAVIKLLGELEDSVRVKLGEIYTCDPDEIPVDFDINKIYECRESGRREMLVIIEALSRLKHI
jgi:hypothetical protein